MKAKALMKGALQIVGLAIGLANLKALPPSLTGDPKVDFSKPNYAYSPLLEKFKDSLPTWTSTNNLGQTIPVAQADTTSFPGSDYYEIALVQYREQMHSDLPPTLLRGYVQEVNGVPVTTPHQMGPWINAQSGRPVRVKFTNRLPIGAQGDLFLPVDTTIMGAGQAADGSMFTQNRGSIHLHGGLPAWTSDGTPHQWVAPAGENTTNKKGVNAVGASDMDVPADGSMTFFWPNGHSGRMLWYHDHTYGLTRLNVYAGEVAGYLVQDPDERALTAGMPEIPLVIQDKTFVPDQATLDAKDPLWDTAKWGGQGNLWFPHVYMPNQDPTADSGALDWGRWDYGPWFWPPWNVIPGTLLPTVSAVPESYHDTPVINGTAYPYIEVDPTEVRLHILNAANERYWNLQWYVADPAARVNASNGKTYNNTEVRMIPANPDPSLPDYFPLMAGDDRRGGVPDPLLAGPAWLQIGNEAGILPNPAIIKNVPIGYSYNRRTVVVLNVQEHALWLGPAERADVVVDFTPYAGQTLILYNDSGAPVPAFDPRNDHYTDNDDQTDSGGSPTTLAGMGPNTRTILQVRVRGTAAKTPSPAPGTPGTLPVNWINPDTQTRLTAAMPAYYKKNQSVPIVPQPWFDSVGYTYNNQTTGTNATDAHAPIKIAHINDTSITYTPYGSTTPVTMPFIYKALHELFNSDGRMNAVLGTELPFTSAYIQTTLPLAYVDPATEVLQPGETQFWWIAHNGVDTHVVHFHLVELQVINRVGWDGATYNTMPVDDNEQGWKDSVKMNPLENTLVAVRAKTPLVPFGVPEAIRPLDVTRPLGSTNNFSGIDPLTGQPLSVINAIVNNKWEYMWHCHLLGHEENDMMRPIQFLFNAQTPSAATGLAVSKDPNGVLLTWTDPTPADLVTTWGNPQNEVGFKIQRAPVNALNQIGTYTQIAVTPANRTAFVDSTGGGNPWAYKVTAYNPAGSTDSSGIIYTGNPPTTPTGLSASLTSVTTVVNKVSVTRPAVALNWTDASPSATSQFVIERSTTADFAAVTTVATINKSLLTYTDTAVAVGNVYYYRVSAANGAGMSQPSVSANVSLVLPTAPSGLAAAFTPNQVSLTWTSTASNANSMLLERSTSQTFAGITTQFTLPSTATSYVDTTIAANTTYYYRVSAVNTILGNSTPSNVASVSIQLPATPTGLTAVFVPNNVNLAWTSTATYVDSFLVERAANANFTGAITSFTVPSTATTYVDTSLAAVGTYHYRVSAVHAFLGKSTASASASVVVTAPAAPTGLSASFSPNVVNLAWTSTAVNADSFLVERATSANFTGIITSFTVASTATTFVDASLTAAGTYYYRVSAVSSVFGKGIASTSANVVITAPAQAGSLAFNFVAASGTTPNTVNLSWTIPAGLNSVVVQRSTSTTFPVGTSTISSANLVSSSPTSFSDSTTVTLGTTYYYRVVLTSVIGSSTSATLTVPLVLPTAPTMNAATTNAFTWYVNPTTGTTNVPSVTINWTKAGTVAVTSFSVQRDTVNTFNSANLQTYSVAVGTSPATAWSYTDTTVTGGTTYYYRVAAVNTVGTSASSTTATLPLATGIAPTNFAVASSTTTTANLSWSLATNPASWTLQRSTDPTFVNSVTTTTNLAVTARTANVTGLATKTKYYWRLKANYGTGATQTYSSWVLLTGTTP